MPINWEDVRFRGDARDVEDFLETYRVNDYLDAFEENRKQIDRGIREKLNQGGHPADRAAVAAEYTACSTRSAARWS